MAVVVVVVVVVAADVAAAVVAVTYGSTEKARQRLKQDVTC